MNNPKINVFANVLHKAPSDRNFLVIKGVKVFYLLRYPFLTTTKGSWLPRWSLKANRTGWSWLNSDGKKGFFHHLLQFYTLNFGEPFTHRGFYWRYTAIIIMNRPKSTRNRIRSVFHFGKNNDWLADELWVIRAICLITAGRKLIVIIFRTVAFTSLKKFWGNWLPEVWKNRLFGKRW